MKISSFGVSHWILFANAWLALETVEASCRSCTFLGPLEDLSCESDCHSHNAPCLEDIFLYPNNEIPPTNGFFSGIVATCDSCPLITTFVDAQGFGSYSPNNFLSPFASCIPSYNKVVGSCTGYTKTINPYDVFACGVGEAPHNYPWSFDCTYTVETAKGNLMLQGSIPSLVQCFTNLYLRGNNITDTGFQLVTDYINGYITDTDSLVGKCCSDFAITGGTGAYCSAEGSVRICQLFYPFSEYNPQYILETYCDSADVATDFGVSFNFDGLKGCEKKKCCDAPKVICG